MLNEFTCLLYNTSCHLQTLTSCWRCSLTVNPSHENSTFDSGKFLQFEKGSNIVTAMAPRRQGWIDWRKSEAKATLMYDLEHDFIPLVAEEMPASECWEIYQHCPEFAGVQFDQFEARLKDHRVAVAKMKDASFYDEEAFIHDRRLYPRKTHNQRGDAVFDKSDAQEKLREDVRNKKHKRMSPTDLYWSRREYYEVFSLDKFRGRIYQEERHQKFIFYLARRRLKKEAKFEEAARKRGAATAASAATTASAEEDADCEEDVDERYVM